MRASISSHSGDTSTGRDEHSLNSFPKTEQLSLPPPNKPSLGCARVQRFTFTATTVPVPLPISSRNLRGSISMWPQCKGCAVVGEATGQSCSFRQPLLSKLQPFWAHSPDKAFRIIAVGDGCWVLRRRVPITRRRSSSEPRYELTSSVQESSAC